MSESVSHSGAASVPPQEPPLIRVESIRKGFTLHRGTIVRRQAGCLWAVDGISFEIQSGETLGLVGESGCGKTTTSHLLLLLEQPTSGAIYYRGMDIHALDSGGLKRYRRAVQAVFQDPWSSLNPRMRVGSIIAEPMKVNTRLSRTEIAGRVEQLLVQVGLQSWHARLYPHEFSGGQRQRITLARAISLKPEVVVLDEPVSALDVSVQAQIMNLLKDLQEQEGMSYFLIAHNLGTVQYLCHRVAVMYLGEIVEEGLSEDLFAQPLHPYTQALIAAALPARVDRRDDEKLLEGEVPSPAAPPAGCRFHTRCPAAMPRCAEEKPAYRELSPGHWVSCHLY